jgi:hypothetical protein
MSFTKGMQNKSYIIRNHHPFDYETSSEHVGNNLSLTKLVKLLKNSVERWLIYNFFLIGRCTI